MAGDGKEIGGGQDEVNNENRNNNEENEESHGGGEQTTPVPPIDVLDPVAVHRGINDCISKLITFTEYKENFSISNAKLVIMGLACAIATFATLGPHSFPENRSILGVCVGLYTGLCLLLQILSVFIEKDIVVTTYDLPNKPKSALQISTMMEKGESTIRIKVEFVDALMTHSEETSFSVGRYYSKLGDIDERALQSDLVILISRMHDQYYKKDK